MAKADTGNAHIRKTSRRESPEVQSEDAKRLLNDPAFERGVERVREGLVAELENFKSSGSPEDEDYEREICRSLRTLKRVRLAIAGSVQGQTLREAGFRPLPRDKDE